MTTPDATVTTPTVVPAEIKPSTTKKAPEPVVAEEIPPQPSPEVLRVRLREEYVHAIDGHTYVLQAGRDMDSQNYNIDKMLENGAQLDLLDEDGDVIANLNEV